MSPKSTCPEWCQAYMRPKCLTFGWVAALTAGLSSFSVGVESVVRAQLQRTCFHACQTGSKIGVVRFRSLVTICVPRSSVERNSQLQDATATAAVQLSKQCASHWVRKCGIRSSLPNSAEAKHKIGSDCISKSSRGQGKGYMCCWVCLCTKMLLSEGCDKC
jgi:hypothetical protein